jgi:chromosome partitioning protein
VINLNSPGKAGTTIAFCLQKGGVGKTTTTLSLAKALHAKKKDVLVIDLDPQANLTQGLGFNLDKLEADNAYSIYEVLLQPERSPKFAIMTYDDDPDGHLDIIPSTLNLAQAEVELNGKIGRETLLARALYKVRFSYDYVLIDTPPSLGLFTLNALCAAHYVIIPMQLQPYALSATQKFFSTIELVQHLNPVSVLGIVGTMHDRRTNLSALVLEDVRSRFGEGVFDTVIPVSVKLAESPATGTSIFEYAPGSPAAVAYAALADEMEARLGR